MKLGSEATHLKKDLPSVDSEGRVLKPLIDGVKIKHLQPRQDRRGDITEMYSPEWGLSTDAMVYAYQVSILPGAIRGWELHMKQVDRIFMSSGVMRWALYDLREDSPTYQMLNEFVVSELDRVLMIVPTGIIHAVQNIGSCSAVFINFPTEPYRHQDPDKHRLPLGAPLIPFSFDNPPGW